MSPPTSFSIERPRLGGSLARADLPAAVALVLFALAVAIPSARSALLACTTAASAAWIGAIAVAGDRRGPRARLVMALALSLLGALPALLLAFDHALWIGPPRLRGLDAGLVLWSIAIAAIAVGVRLTGPRRTPRLVTQEIVPATPRPQRWPLIALVALVIVSLVAFVHEVGGPIAYLRHLNESAAANAGLTYLIWGISFSKYIGFAYLGECWAAARRPSRAIGAGVVVAFVLLLFLGDRLLLLVALIQILLLRAALRPISRRFKLVAVGVAVFGAVAFLLIGEFRRWENVPSPRPSFTSYFVHVSLPGLPRTVVNNYADTVRSSVVVRQVVPVHAGYEDGKELLRILLQPLPGSIRPTVSLAPALTAAFTSGHKNGNALPLPVVGYIQFGLAGAVLFCLVLGAMVGFVDRLGDRIRTVGELLAVIATSTGLVIVFRGTLHNAIALAAIDVIGFYAAHRFLFSRAPARSTSPGAEQLDRQPKLSGLLR